LFAAIQGIGPGAFVRIRWQWMGFQPQRASDDGRIDTGLIPPRAFISAVMNFAVVTATERDGEFIANLAAKRATLRRSKMMGIGGTAAADKARLLGNRFNMLPVANPARRRQGQYGLVDNSSRSPPFSSMVLSFVRDLRSIRSAGSDVSQPISHDVRRWA
jgi:hypothetical protein